MKVNVCTTNAVTGQGYRITDAVNLQSFVSYGQSGGGFGYLSFTLPRKIGYDYQDIGYAHRCRVYKGPFRCLFDGQIARITETRTTGADQIQVWCLGWVHVATADTYNHIYADTRYTEWTSSEEPSGSFQPQKFSWEASDGLLLKPRRGSTEDGDFVSENDYTYIRYTFPFGENAVRLVANYALALPGSFPGKLQVLADDQLLWESATTGDGSIDVTATGKTTFEVRFAITDTGNITAVDGTVYGLLYNLGVYSVNVASLGPSDLAEDLVTYLSTASHGLSDKTLKIDDIGINLSHMAFDTDQTPADIMTWASQFGNSSGKPVAWGVLPDDRKLFYLESQDLSSLKYVIYPNEANVLERSGDWSDSAQRVYATYSDTDGVLQRTSDLVDTSTIAKLGGYSIRRALSLDGVTNSVDALVLTNTWLNENGKPKTSGSYTVRSAHTPDGRLVAADEVLPGGLVQVLEFRAIEADLATDLRDKVTTFMLVGVRVDFDNQTAELMPDADSSEFQRQMAIVAALQEQ